MRLTTLLPRPLDPAGGSECASLLGSLLTAVHLERRRARALGWRGILPSATAEPAWTCRVAGSEHVFGLVFLGEEINQAGNRLLGQFGVCLFPRSEHPVLDRFPLAALRQALREDYSGLVREFSSHVDELAPFRIGGVWLEAALDGGGLSLGLQAAARHRMTALEGIAAEGDWIVPPGGLECDVPQFRLLLPLFAVLVATAEDLLEERADIFRSVAATPALGFDAGGVLHPLPEGREHLLRLDAVFGAGPARENGAARRLKRLPLRRRTESPAAAERPVLHVLTGFLGSGKTTFLRRWLDFLHGRERYTGVIQNEFGEIGLDAALLQDDTRVEALDDGCVCCSLADSLRPGLERLIADLPAEQFILETTGLANPANVLASLGELGDLVAPGLVIAVLDALDLARSRGSALQRRGVLRAQAEAADVLILNKADAVDGATLDDLLRRAAAVNPRARLFPARQGGIAFAELDALLCARKDRSAPAPPRGPLLMPREGNQPTHEEEGYQSRTVRFREPVTAADLRSLLTESGPGLCRAKGLVELRGEGPRVVQYAAGRLAFEPAPLGEDDEAREGYLVLIGTGLRRKP